MLIASLVLSVALADSAPTSPPAMCLGTLEERVACLATQIAELRIREQGGGAVITTVPVVEGKRGYRGKPGVDGVDGTDGVNGKSTLSTSVPELPGAHCPAGGVKVGVGLDLNGDKALQMSEVTNTYYVCSGVNGTNGTNGRDASPVRLAVTGAGGGIWMDDPHLAGTHIEGLWTSSVGLSVSQLKPSGVGWEAGATLMVAGSASTGASGGAGLFYGSSRGRAGLRISYFHIEAGGFDDGLVTLKGDGGQVRLFLEINLGDDGHLFVTGSAGGSGLWITDGGGGLFAGTGVADAGIGYRF